MQGWHFPKALIESSLIGGVVRVTYMLKMAEISCNPREPKSGYVYNLRIVETTVQWISGLLERVRSPVSNSSSSSSTSAKGSDSTSSVSIAVSSVHGSVSLD